MIAGTIILEDQAITFKITSTRKDPNNAVTYTVCDCASGKEETKTVNGKSFMFAIGIALNWDGEIPEESAYKLAESVQPDDMELRFIP